MDLIHDDQSTPPPLDELAALVQSETDTFALTIGNYFDQAMRRSKRKFPGWVLTSTPFSLAEAHRLRGVFIAYRDLPSETIRSLPRPSSALSYVMEAESTEPYASATAEFTREDLLAGALLGSHPETLSSDVRESLVAWLGLNGS
jgi:hypothetical protein